MKSKIFLLIICIVFALTGCIPPDDISEAEKTDNEKAFLFSDITINGDSQDLGKAYQIDIDYMAEMEENKDAVPGVKLEITYKYADLWEEKMNYYFDLLYDGMSKIEENPPDEFYIAENFKLGKEALVKSQEDWLQSLDSDRDLIGARYVMERAMIDVFSSFYYNAYRKRAIDLYFISINCGFLYDSLEEALE